MNLCRQKAIPSLPIVSAHICCPSAAGPPITPFPVVLGLSAPWSPDTRAEAMPAAMRRGPVPPLCPDSVPLGRRAQGEGRGQRAHDMPIQSQDPAWTGTESPGTGSAFVDAPAPLFQAPHEPVLANHSAWLGMVSQHLLPRLLALALGLPRAWSPAPGWRFLGRTAA